MMTKTIIFDYDGTIHNTLGIYEPAFRETYQWLTEQKAAEEREIGSAEIAGWLGLNSKEMWNTFLPELDQSYKEQAIPVWEKYSLNVSEAAEYYGIGEKRLRQIAGENEGADFILEVGSHIRFKRKLFEDYLDTASTV